jgi:hypothetical protein
MRFVKVGEKLVNVALVAYAEREPGGDVVLYFAVPKAPSPSGAMSVGATGGPLVTARFGGRDASDLWQQLQAP